MIRISDLFIDGIESDMFLNFNHHQLITKKWVKKDNKWELVDADNLREWSKEKRIWITKYLNEQIERGGSVKIAYDGGILVGFCSVDGYLLGNTARYANLTMLFVDDEWKRNGIGKCLFEEICKSAVKMNAEKLFISAIPSLETIAFYFSMGCEDAKEIISEYIDTENDRYLEYSLINKNAT